MYGGCRICAALATAACFSTTFGGCGEDMSRYRASAQATITDPIEAEIHRQQVEDEEREYFEKLKAASQRK
jgi:hypothetical protein